MLRPTALLSLARWAICGVVGQVAFASAPLASEWVIDKAASSIRFEVHTSGATLKGEFKRFAAAVTFDPIRLDAAKATVDVDLSSVALGDATLDKTLTGPEWFDVQKTPTARFVTTAFRKTAAGFETDGTLALRGVSVPLTLPFTFSEDGNTATVAGSVALDRAKWPIGGAQFRDESAVSFPVKVSIAVKASRRS